jgi:micrococcal nuclease
MNARAALVAALLVLAGCTGVAPTAESGTPAVDLPDDTTEVSVTAVVDGDTIRIEYDNGTSDTVRLVGVDTPETNAENDPTEYEGVPDTEAGATCLGAAGRNATNFAVNNLLGDTVGIATDPNTDRRGYYDRLLAYVVDDGRLFNYRLVETGHARVYTESDFSREETFVAAETAARDQRRGLWQCSDPDAATFETPTVTASESGLALVEINADAEGNDNENLNDEYLVFENRGDETLDLTGWTVTDEAGRSYTFGEVTLAPDASITLHTGSGTDTDSDVYWGQSGAVWNNGGDTVTVRNADGAVVIEQSY